MSDPEMTEVSTLDEWMELASKNPRQQHVADVSGELADRIRERFKSAPDAPVRMSYTYNGWFTFGWLLTIECGERGGSDLKDVACEICGMGDIEYVRAWLEDREPDLTLVVSKTKQPNKSGEAAA